MSGVFNFIYVVAAVLLLFGAAVFVHELGHYVVARLCGMKVLEFAIGFGPKVFGWTRNGIAYTWRAIPAGVFVKLPQMVTSEALEGNAGEDPLPPAPAGAKILVAVAGPLMNVVFAFVIAGILYFVGLPIAVNPPIIGHVDEKSDEFKMGLREGDVIVKLDGKMVRSWQDVQVFPALARTNVLELVTERSAVRSTNHVAARINEVFGLKMLNPEPRDHPVIAEVQSDSPAAKAGLKEGDRFISFAGVPIVGQQQLIDLIRKRGGEPTEVVVERNKKPLNFTVTPVVVDAEHKTGRIGTMLTGDSTLVYRVMKPGPKPWDLVRSEE